MPEFLEVAVDKFVFRVARDRLFTPEGVWASEEAGNVRVGLSDFTQQRSGDLAFVEVNPAGASVKAGEEIASIETVKVTVELPSPVSGRIAKVNPVLREHPERVNEDPYGDGWLVIVEASDWPADRARLLTPQAYLDVVKRQAGEEAETA
jgi:glycine cleavage system H protein